MVKKVKTEQATSLPQTKITESEAANPDTETTTELSALPLLPLTLGLTLRQARRQKKLKLSSVAKKLCIKEIYLDALEQGHYHIFPALVYGIGFLRSYATFLGLNADEMVDLFYRETTDIKTDTLDMPQADNPKVIPTTKIIIKSLFLLFLFFLMWSVVQVLAYKPVPLPQLNAPILQEIPPEPGISDSEDANDSTAPLVADELTPPPAVISPKKTVQSSTPAGKRHQPVSYGLKTPASVSFVATAPAHIEVRDSEANQVLLAQNLQPGDRFNPAEDSEGLVFKTDNAGAIMVHINGRAARALGATGQTKIVDLTDKTFLTKD